MPARLLPVPVDLRLAGLRRAAGLRLVVRFAVPVRLVARFEDDFVLRELPLELRELLFELRELVLVLVWAILPSSLSESGPESSSGLTPQRAALIADSSRDSSGAAARRPRSEAARARR
jgi:hypothetical protein